MKRLLFFFLPILLTSCSSLGSIFSPIRTIKCKKIDNVEFTYLPKSVKKGEPEVVIFNKNSGELFFYDSFFETLTPLSQKEKKWIKSTIVNGKLKINQGENKIWGKAIINLKDLNGTLLNDFSGQYVNEEKITRWDLKCVKVKNISTKIK